MIYYHHNFVLYRFPLSSMDGLSDLIFISLRGGLAEILAYKKIKFLRTGILALIGIVYENHTIA